MATCRFPLSKNNFIRWDKLFPGKSLAALQADGLPEFCDPGDLPPPTNLTATGASGQIDLAWNDNAFTETGFQIERKTADTSFSLIHTTAANATSYSDTTAAVGILYTYRVRAVGADTTFSQYSNEASAKVNEVGLFGDGTNDFVRESTDAIDFGAGTSSPDSDFTFVCIVHPQNTGDAKYTILGRNVANTGYWSLGFGTTDKMVVNAFMRNDASARFTEGTHAFDVLDANKYDITRFVAFNRITNTIGNWQMYLDGTIQTGLTTGAGATLLAGDTINWSKFQFLDNGTGPLAGFTYGGFIDEHMIFQPALTQAQLDWLYNSSASNTRDPRTAAAKAQGIGVSGIDTVGVNGITTILLRYWRFNAVTEDSGSYYVREEVTDTTLYAAGVNYADPANDMIQEY